MTLSRHYEPSVSLLCTWHGSVVQEAGERFGARPEGPICITPAACRPGSRRTG
jgi:hypothetical protein